MVHWLGLVDFTAMALSSILGQVTKILQAMQFSQTTKKKTHKNPTTNQDCTLLIQNAFFQEKVKRD